MSLPPTSVGPPNAAVTVAPGVTVQAATIIAPPAGAVIAAGTGRKSNVSVPVQAGMNVRAICLVNAAGQFINLY